MDDIYEAYEDYRIGFPNWVYIVSAALVGVQLYVGASHKTTSDVDVVHSISQVTVCLNTKLIST